MWEEVERELEVATEELSSACILFENRKYRDSISRAYYSMFHAARALLLLKGLVPKKHSGTISLFGKYYVKDGEIEDHYGKSLTKAFQLRSMADYNVMYIPTREEAEEILNSAEEFLERAKEMVERWRRREP